MPIPGGHRSINPFDRDKRGGCVDAIFSLDRERRPA